jgi:hypothetical protein
MLDAISEELRGEEKGRRNEERGMRNEVGVSSILHLPSSVLMQAPR